MLQERLFDEMTSTPIFEEFATASSPQPLLDVMSAVPMPASTAADSATGNIGIELFGSFLLDGAEFALPAAAIQEVVNFPEKMTPIPLSPAFMEGIFTLRGTVIPVLNLSRIFDQGGEAAKSTQKIAIIDHQHVQIGILFDGTGSILRVRPEQRSALQYRNPATKGVVMETIRLDDARLLQVLDPAALCRIENVPQLHAMKSLGRHGSNSELDFKAKRRQCVSFRVAGTSFGFEMAAIQEIINVPPLKPSVMKSKLCIGRIDFRGNALAVADFSRLLSLRGVAVQAQPDQRIIVICIGGSAIGLLVDSVDSIMHYHPSEVWPIPLLSKSRAGMFSGCIHKEGMEETILLDHRAIFSDTEIIEITDGHVNLYQQEATQSELNSGTDQQCRKVYLTFLLNTACAVQIEKIHEIIAFPDSVIKPPSMPAFVHGITRLRQHMVTLIDMRSFYGMPPLADMCAAKVMVIGYGGEFYGLIIDDVEGMVMVTDSQRMPWPKMARADSAGELYGQISDVIQLPVGDNAKRTLGVFDTAVFLDRLAREMNEG